MYIYAYVFVCSVYIMLAVGSICTACQCCFSLE